MNSRRLSTAEPRWATQRSPERPTKGPEIARAAEMFGTPFMPHQRMVADVMGEMVRDEEYGIWLPAYPSVVITIMRQNGKTTILLAASAHRLVVWDGFDGRAQTVTYTAQTGMDAVQKFREDWIPTWMNSPFRSAIQGRPRLSAQTGVGWDIKGGGWLRVLNNSATAGHGKTVDQALMDEIFADEDSSREQAMGPAMATRHDAQTIMASTAGHEKSVLLNQKQAAGRAAVEADKRDGIAYFEWSADPDDDPEDPATWWNCMPALGYTITERTVRNKLEEMKTNPQEGIDEFRRAWLNIPRGGAGSRSVVPPELWQQVEVSDVQPAGGQAIAVDAQVDRSSASIFLADSQHRAKLVAHSQGTAWLLPMLVENAKRLRVPVVLDMRGPVPHLADDLEAEGVEVIRFGTADMVRACSRFWELLGDSKLRVKAAPPLSLAVESAAKRPVGDAWLWLRPQSVDASPLVALTMAIEAASGRGEWKGPPAVWA